ncbi:MAG: GlxA family transcriptional regulator [Pseudomonadota bacterium]
MSYSSGQSGSSNPKVTPDVSVAFLLSPDFTLLPLAGFIDAMRHAADEADNSRQIYCRWTCLSATQDPIRSSCGLEVLPWGPLKNPQAYDYVVVVGGLLSSMDQYLPETFPFIRAAVDAGRSVIGLCTGSFVIAEAGLMAGRRCAVHTHHRRDFIRLFPDAIPIVNEMYVFDGPIITCPGGTAAIDLAVDVLSQHCGKSRGMKGLTALVVDEHRGAHQIGRFPYQDLENCGDWRIERAVRIMRQNLGTPMRIEDLAQNIGSTVRQLERSFQRHARKLPLALWRDMRLQHSRWRLLNTTRSVTEIAFECGFADASHFSRWFKKEFGEPPQTYRQNRASEVRQG